MQKLIVGAFAILLMSTVAALQPIKQSSSGICHASDSAHYERTINFTAFDNIDDCVKAGGRLPKGYTPKATSKSEHAEYSRDQFGSGWGDMDGDCQDSRQEALIAQSTSPVHFKDGDSCRVASGRWISPYSNRIIHDPSAIDIDHVVPLKWAWEHGADKWSKDKRVQLANDAANLLSVEASLNRQKGAKGPDEWLPPTNQCQYLARFYRIVLKYKIELNSDEQEFKKGVFTNCN